MQQLKVFLINDNKNFAYLKLTISQSSTNVDEHVNIPNFTIMDQKNKDIAFSEI